MYCQQVSNLPLHSNHIDLQVDKCMVMKYRSTCIGPWGYHVGRSHISAWATVQSFYMSRPRQHVESARALRTLGPWWYRSTWTGPCIYCVGQGPFRIGQSVIIAWAIYVSRSTQTGPGIYHVGQRRLSDPPVPYKTLGHNYIRTNLLTTPTESSYP